MKKGTKPLKGITTSPKIRWDEDEWLFLIVMALPFAFLVSIVFWFIVVPLVYRFFFH